MTIWPTLAMRAVEIRKNRLETAVRLMPSPCSSRLGKMKLATMLAWVASTSRGFQANSRPVATMARVSPA